MSRWILGRVGGGRGSFCRTRDSLSSLRRRAPGLKVFCEAGVPDPSKHCCVGLNGRGFNLFIAKVVRVSGGLLQVFKSLV